MRTALASLLLLAVCVPVFAAGRADYDTLQKWQFATAAAPLAAPVTFTRDTANWTLTSGTIRLMQPTSDGRVTGFVFEGDGRFTMTIPDRVERTQLARFTNRDGAGAIDQKFTQAVVRFSDEAIAKLFAAITPSSYAPNDLAAKRHEHWLINLGIDVDARVLEASLNEGALELAAAMKTADFDWITYEYDSNQQEEIRVIRYNAGYPERWIGLQRAEDRDADGRPSGVEHRQLVMSHAEIDADLTRFRIGPGVGLNEQRVINGHYVVTTTVTAMADGVGAPRMYVGGRARGLKVRDENGAEIPYLRDAIGKRSMNIGNDVHDGEATLLLATPMKKGEQRRFTFEYDYDTANFAPGGAWYPSPVDSFQHPHTARLAFTFNKRLTLRSMGRLEKESHEGEHKTAVWVVERPAKMITFSTADRFEEIEIKVDGIPRVVVFGPDYMSTSKAKMRNVGADVANSLQYFQNLLEDKIGGETMYVTSIAAGHGQAFDGFLHMSEATFTGDHPGASELFRAHEVAHSWWGHRVGWKSYRDQWLSESIAEYTAMMFVQGFVKGGDKLFNEMLLAYEGIVKGDLRGGFSKFSRPWLIEMNAAHRERIGPIDLGYRAGTREIPAAYMIQAYYKGPLVLHMLRSLLLYRTGSDEAFVKVLREFNREWRGKAPSTADFRRTLERVVPTDWSFFFDAWIYGADIPRFTWNYKVEPADGGAYKLTMNIKRTGVADTFVTPIPVRVEYEDGTASILFVPSKLPEQTLSHKVAKKPRNVTFGPEHSLLAHIRRD